MSDAGHQLGIPVDQTMHGLLGHVGETWGDRHQMDGGGGWVMLTGEALGSAGRAPCVCAYILTSRPCARIGGS